VAKCGWERVNKRERRSFEQKVTEVTRADCHFETDRISSLAVLLHITKNPLNFSDLCCLCYLLFKCYLVAFCLFQAEFSSLLLAVLWERSALPPAQFPVRGLVRVKDLEGYVKRKLVAAGVFKDLRKKLMSNFMIVINRILAMQAPHAATSTSPIRNVNATSTIPRHSEHI
jgi:hypothetical protein